MGLLAVLSAPASTTSAWRELAKPMNCSLSVQLTDASIMSAFLDYSPKGADELVHFGIAKARIVCLVEGTQMRGQYKIV